jgi:phospholipid/cholesterol/gamma-HCH transport system substrate-binding protein
MRSFSGRNPVPIAVIGILAILAVTVGAFSYDRLLGRGTGYHAEFREAAGLAADDIVTIAGVEAGRVRSVELAGDRVLVSFDVQDAYVGDLSTASIEVRTILGAKSLALDPRGDAPLEPGATIPLERTFAPFDVLEAFNGLSATIDQLDTEQVAAGLTTLADTFRDTSPEVRGALDGLSRLSRTVASRDDEIRSLLAGTRELASQLNGRNDEIVTLLRDGDSLLAELQRRRDAIEDLLEATVAVSQQLRGLVHDNSAQLTPALESLDHVTQVLERNRRELEEGLKLQAVFIRLFTNSTGNGRWFDNCTSIQLGAGPVLVGC